MSSYHNQDCCEHNFLDFEQFMSGDEFPDCDKPDDFLNLIVIKEDGFVLKDVNGIPKWAQARSEQNGYYSNMLGIEVGKEGLIVKTPTECLAA